jgi:hypothetical protein
MSINHKSLLVDPRWIYQRKERAFTTMSARLSTDAHQRMDLFRREGGWRNHELEYQPRATSSSRFYSVLYSRWRHERVYLRPGAPSTKTPALPRVTLYPDHRTPRWRSIQRASVLQPMLARCRQSDARTVVCAHRIIGNVLSPSLTRRAPPRAHFPMERCQRWRTPALRSRNKP